MALNGTVWKHLVPLDNDDCEQVWHSFIYSQGRPSKSKGKKGEHFQAGVKARLRTLKNKIYVA